MKDGTMFPKEGLALVLALALALGLALALALSLALVLAFAAGPKTRAVYNKQITDTQTVFVKHISLTRLLCCCYYKIILCFNIACNEELLKTLHIGSKMA